MLLNHIPFPSYFLSEVITEHYVPNLCFCGTVLHFHELICVFSMLFYNGWCQLPKAPQLVSPYLREDVHQGLLGLFLQVVIMLAQDLQQLH